jgi:hypothetical protein
VPNIYEYLLAIMSAISLLLSFLSFRDRRSKEQAEPVTDQLIALNKSQKATDIKVAVLEERINNEIQILDKLDEKLDDYLK